MKLYHITRDHSIEYLKPMIPSKVLEGENKDIARISLAESVENCFKSVHWNRDYYNKWDNNSFELYSDRLITVFEFDVSDIDEKNLIPPKEIRLRYGVDDAEASTEYWVIGTEIKNIVKYSILPTKLSEVYIHIYPIGVECEKCVSGECSECIDETHSYILREYLNVD